MRGDLIPPYEKDFFGTLQQVECIRWVVTCLLISITVRQKSDLQGSTDILGSKEEISSTPLISAPSDIKFQPLDH